MNNLFIKHNFISHSGLSLDFKIECDSFTDVDIETIAYIISKRFNFYGVFGIPRGGIRLEKALYKYKDPTSNNFLIVDDVLTSGQSFIDTLDTIHSDYIWGSKIIGVVIFARGKCPRWVYPIFQLWNK